MPIDITKKVAFLKMPSSYADRPEKVRVKETHHSWVFLTDKYVYKLKKPVKNQRHDYETVEKRRFNCLEELRLNRRLARPIYLEVLPLRVDKKGGLQFKGTGRIVDWLVKMKRIPAANLLDTSIKNHTVTPEEVDRAATKLALFYQRAVPRKTNYSYQREKFDTELQYCREVLSRAQFGLDATLIEHLYTDLHQFLSAGESLFRKRIELAKIIEGHGDLRPEHICLRPRPYFIDCLEFDKELRTLDPIDDLSYLSLECDLLGRPDIGETFFRKYAEFNPAEFSKALKHFYKAFRAMIRARLAASHHLETQYQRDPAWITKARRYLQQAQRNVKRINLLV